MNVNTKDFFKVYNACQNGYIQTLNELIISIEKEEFHQIINIRC
jgi:hypothetical protein